MNDEICCPYNPNHKISPSKLEMHLLKSHKKEKKKLLQCQKNASIKFFKEDKKKHLKICNYCKNLDNSIIQPISNENEQSFDKKIQEEPKLFYDEGFNVSQIIKRNKKKHKKERQEEEDLKIKNENYNLCNENNDNTQLY